MKYFYSFEELDIYLLQRIKQTNKTHNQVLHIKSSNRVYFICNH